MIQRLGLAVFWRRYDRAATLRAVQIADDAGYDSFWVPEAWGYEVFGLIAEMARCTTRIKLGTAIVNIFSRSPALLAMSAATADDISGGRFILGLGTSAPSVIEKFHGVPYERPLQRLRECILVIKALLRGERLAKVPGHHGYGSFALAMTPVRRDLPVYCACLRPRAIELVGELADGWMPLFWPYQRIGDGRAALARGARRAGRGADALAVAAFTPVIPCADELVLLAEKRLFASYIGGMSEFYRESLSRLGFATTVDRVLQAWRTNPRAAAAEISPEIVEALTIIGDLPFCIGELERRCAYGIDLPILHLPVGMGEGVAAGYIEMMAPGRQETRTAAAR